MRKRRLMVVLAVAAQPALLTSCGSTTEQPSLLSVTWTAISVGSAHVCGLGTDGVAYCWGSNQHGQLGVAPGTATSKLVNAVNGPIHYTLVSAGSEHSCAVGADAAAYCWGADDAGQLGIGRDKDGQCSLGLFDVFPCRTSPTVVAGGLQFTTLVTGLFHSCGLTPDGVAYCWGMNALGQLGVTNAPDACGATAFPCSTTPVEVAGNLRFTHLAAGAFHTCGVTDAGAAYCWGSNEYGALGTVAPDTCGAAPCSMQPVAVSGALTWLQLTAGYGHTCGVASDGQAYCWGWSEAGQLGTTATQDTCEAGLCIPQPTPVEGNIAFAQLAGGDNHTCGITAAGAGYCWGQGDVGELGNGAIGSSRTPVAVVGNLIFAQISAGGQNSCAVDLSKKAYCWGDNTDGQLGRSEFFTESVPVEVTGQ